MERPTLDPLDEKFHSLQRKLLGCAGYKIHRYVRALDQSTYIFERNYAELVGALKTFQRPDAIMVFWAEKNRGKLQAFQIEISRLLHNFLASVKSLVEHTRILLVQELYKDNRFKDEIRARIKSQFDDSDLSHFVQDLRNYILHKGLPMTAAQLQFTKDAPNFDSSIQLDIDALREWDRWSKPSMKHLNSLGKTSSLFEITESYSNLALSFNKWIKHRQEELHKNEFEEMNAIKTEYEKLRARY